MLLLNLTVRLYGSLQPGGSQVRNTVTNLRARRKSTPPNTAVYGGYCAHGVSQGHTAPIDPEAWTIVEGKLYLNYSQGVKRTWSEAIPKHIEEANQNWPGLHQ